MKMRGPAANLAILIAAMGLAACTASRPEGDVSGSSQPFRADFNADGFATILSAPPAAFDPVEPAPPAPRTADQDAADAEFMRVAEFEPARDSHGNPMASYYVSSILYRM